MTREDALKKAEMRWPGELVWVYEQNHLSWEANTITVSSLLSVGTYGVVRGTGSSWEEAFAEADKQPTNIVVKTIVQNVKVS
jgi:hypothetical protein